MRTKRLGTTIIAGLVGALLLASATPAFAELPTPSLRISAPVAVRSGVRLALSGSASAETTPGEALVIVLQRKSGTTWSTVATAGAALTPSRTFSASVVAGARGHWRAIATVGANDAHAGAASRPVAYKVVGRKVVALTFDDGPWRGSTDKIVAALKRGDADATFFMLGSQVNRQRARARSVVAAGNVAAVHSWNHPIMTRRSSRTNAADLRRCISVIRSATGTTPRWFRPPYGSTSRSLKATAKSVGLRQVIWNVDTLDWRDHKASLIASRAVRGTRSGSVVLMHDGGGNRSATVAAVPRIIRSLRAKGYDFVTLDELYALGYRPR